MLYSFTMVNSMKNILIKKNHLTCDNTTEEVLTTSLYHYNNIYKEHSYSDKKKDVS